MKKKNILIIPPDTPDPSYIDALLAPLHFLEDKYNLVPMDSLSIMDEVSNEEFYSLWAKKLAPIIPHYDAFFGFSFGGVILQQCFSQFKNTAKSIVLFSTPSFADDALDRKLNEVIDLCEQGSMTQALDTLYQHVYYPNSKPLQTHQLPDEKTAAQRVIYGLKRVLQTDSRPVLLDNTVNHLHLVGERSQLVNSQNVIDSAHGRKVIVPDAGMRMLRDNPRFCQQLILEALIDEK